MRRGDVALPLAGWALTCPAMLAILAILAIAIAVWQLERARQG